MRFSVTVLLAGAGIIGSVLSTAAMAEPYGLLNGRSADVSRMPDMSVEAGAVLGEIDDLDYEHFGARLNYKVNPTVMAYGDIGQSELENFDGVTFGLGAFFQIDGILTGNDFGVHASYHKVDLDGEGNREVSGNSIVVEALISGKEPIGANDNMGWNASIGLNRQSGEGDTDTELTFSGGIVLQTAAKTGEFYASILYVDDLGFGAGYRFFLN